MFWTIFWSSWGAVGVGSARILYGKLRTSAIQEYGLNWIDAYEGKTSVFWYVVVLTSGAIPLWPLALLAWIIFGNPPKAPKELEAELEIKNRKLSEMEAELDKALGRES